jgi:hypothetical protein
MKLPMEEFNCPVVPACGVDALTVTRTVREARTKIVLYSKAQSVLFGTCSFGLTPGTGKTMVIHDCE